MAYSDNQFSAMQEEAVRRVREMQKRSRSMVGESEETLNSEQTAKEKAVQNAASALNTSDMGKGGAGGILSSLLGTTGAKNGELFNIGSVKIDEEKALIGLLIYILYKQGADVKLLLGLGYLLI